MEQSEAKGLWARYALFLVLSFGILLAHAYFNAKHRPPVARQGAGENELGEKPKAEADAPGKPDGADRGDVAPAEVPEAAEKPIDADPAADPAAEPKPEPDGEPAEPPRAPPEPRLVALGSADPKSPYRMQVTLTNRGAAVARIELSSDRFRDLEDRSGYLGHLVMDETVRGKGCPVDVVAPGTPAAKAGLKRGDRITAVDDQPVDGFRALRRVLEKRKPGQSVRLSVLRGGEPLTLTAELIRRPLELVRPEGDDPLSFLLTLRQLDDRRLDPLIEAAKAGDQEESKKDKPRDRTVDFELAGLDLRTGTWEIEAPERFDDGEPQSEVTFFRELPKHGLRISKTYRLAEVPEDEHENDVYRGYHLVFDVKIENVGNRDREVAYQLDGPTGLPIEGKWYAHKVGRRWGAAGLRDVVVAWEGHRPDMVACTKIAADDLTLWQEGLQPNGTSQLLDFIGVDAQYFAAMLIPDRADPNAVWFEQLQPLRVGPVDKDWKNATNTSCRLVSAPHALKAGGQPLEHTFTVFAGPKKPRLLEQYGLKQVVYYGWFGWATVPMLHVLHFFHDYVVFNYGLAIIMLTVLVRLCMYPLSHKQAAGAQKMQELQPEIRKIHEKYKNNPEAKMRAQQELFRKHNYNPLSGCLIVFFQLPIFVGLYRGLMVDVELRQAPLISEAIRWCSNLSAPDMLYDWSWFWKSIGFPSVSEGLGLFGLGPYFNVLPIVTIALFIVQQKMLMPPPADEQQAMQQKMMKYMMIFMGFLFFKVASGLCIYFIASSLWGVTERKLLPKPARARPGESAQAPRGVSRLLPTPGTATAAGDRPSVSPATESNRDGAAARRKKSRKKSRRR